uniref:Suppressor of cytokine signaling 6 n=1 Tax=Astyanax mexicanus TaxID=7994 RepID=W5LRX9_ASTMX
MKKISLKTFRKPFNMKGKEDGDFMILQKPSLASEFAKDDALFGGCYTKELACDLHTEDNRGHKNRSKSEGLMGTLKRRLSTKQKAKGGKGVSTSMGSGDDDDTFSSSSVPISFNEVKAQRPLRSSSLCSHHYSPNGDLHLNIEEHYTMPLDEGMYPDSSHSFCLDGSSPMEVMEQVDADSMNVDQGQDDLLSSDMLMDQSVSGLILGNPGIVLQSSSRADAPLLSPSLSPLSSSEIQRTYSGFSATDSHVAERMRHHLNFDPNSAPGVSRVYDSVQSSGPMVVTSLTEELKKLAKQGWYWGPITRWEAEEKLLDLPDGSFLVRDSSDDRYLLSLSFRSQSKTLHTRIEHSNGRFSFYEQPDVEGHTSIVDLIEHSIKDSENGAFCYSRSRLPGSATYPVRLTNPVSRFMQVRSLQYLCRFVIRQYTRIDLIQKLPLPNKMKDYLQEKHY